MPTIVKTSFEDLAKVMICVEKNKYIFDDIKFINETPNIGKNTFNDYITEEVEFDYVPFVNYIYIDFSAIDNYQNFINLLECELNKYQNIKLNTYSCFNGLAYTKTLSEIKRVIKFNTYTRKDNNYNFIWIICNINDIHPLSFIDNNANPISKYFTSIVMDITNIFNLPNFYKMLNFPTIFDMNNSEKIYNRMFFYKITDSVISYQPSIFMKTTNLKLISKYDFQYEIDNNYFIECPRDIFRIDTKYDYRFYNIKVNGDSIYSHNIKDLEDQNSSLLSTNNDIIENNIYKKDIIERCFLSSSILCDLVNVYQVNLIINNIKYIKYIKILDIISYFHFSNKKENISFTIFLERYIKEKTNLNAEIVYVNTYYYKMDNIKNYISEDIMELILNRKSSYLSNNDISEITKNSKKYCYILIKKKIQYSSKARFLNIYDKLKIYDKIILESNLFEYKRLDRTIDF